MRTDQMIGLNERGKEKVDGLDILGITEFDGAWNTMRLLTYGIIEGGEYEPSNRIPKYKEFVQASPWSSGPCYFLALKDSEGKVVEDTLWTEEEMEKYL